MPDQKDTPAHIADVMEAASAAHIYGKPIAGYRVVHDPAQRDAVGTELRST